MHDFISEHITNYNKLSLGILTIKLKLFNLVLKRNEKVTQTTKIT